MRHLLMPLGQNKRGGITYWLSGDTQFQNKPYDWVQVRDLTDRGYFHDVIRDSDSIKTGLALGCRGNHSAMAIGVEGIYIAPVVEDGAMVVG